jgi:hypothetical protein
LTQAQVKKRLSLCREALSNDKSYSTRFKSIYESGEDVERNAMKEFEIAGLFTDRYFQLQQRAWGGIYVNYDQTELPEGAFLPFVRTRFNSHAPIDEGCVWIGSSTEFPLIYVANSIAKWACPYSKMGFVRTEPFLPFHEARKVIQRLSDKRLYPDLDVSFI